MKTFDVFLSYNSLDREIVRQIAAHLSLKRYNLRPWLDVEELRPGFPFQDGLEEVMKTTLAAAICEGGHGEGSWQKPEIRACIGQMVERALPVIPVLLPGAPEKPDLGLFLRDYTWVDLRNGLAEEGLERLYWGITGKKYESPPRPHLAGPPLHNLPFPPLLDLFKGRDEELRRLESALDDPGRTAAFTRSEAITGLGGVGKTRLAVEHTWRCGHRYTAAFFVPTESRKALRSGLAHLAGPALLNLLERTAPSEDEAVAAVLRWLREHPGWLLILDNVAGKDAAVAVGEILPALSEGRVLITSRLKEWPATIRTQRLDTIPRAEAVRFLLDRTAEGREPASDDDEQAGRLAELLGDLPLALAQAAAYISHTRLRLADYRGAWQRKLGWYDSRLMQYPASVVVTWQTTFEQLDPTAATLLRLTAFLAPEPIPVAMFEDGSELVEAAVALFCEETGLEPASSPAREALAELAAYSMAAFQDGGRFTVHRVVQEVMRNQIPENRRCAWIEKALQIVNHSATGNPGDVRRWPAWNLLRPHAARIVFHADEAHIAKPTSRLMKELGKFLQAKSLYAEAEPLMRRALAIDERSFGKEHPRVAIDLNNLASLLKDTNRPAKAEELMRRALRIDEQSFGLEHPRVAKDLSKLALLLKDTNRPAEAEELMRRALAIDEQSFGTEDPRVAVDLSNLALLLKDTNRPAEAEPLMRRAFAIDKQAGRKHLPQVAIDLNNLALLLKDTDRPAEAEDLMLRALAIDEQFFGMKHPWVATDLNTLALLLKDTNRLAEAEPLMQRALVIDELAYGREHPQVAVDLNNHVVLLKDMNRPAEAEPLMQRALDIDEYFFGPEHPKVATDLLNLSWFFLQGTDRLSEAEPLLRRAVGIREKSLPAGDPKTEKARRTLEAFLEQRGTAGA